MSPIPRATRRWYLSAVGMTLLIVVVSAITGFAWLPNVSKDSSFKSFWDAICSSAGLVRARSATGIEPAGSGISRVVVLTESLDAPSSESIGRGGTLALKCTMCHGSRGLSNADTPNLAGQYAFAIYKQLRDYQTGARESAVMSPRVAALTDQDMRDLAAYYASLPRADSNLTAESIPSIVQHGAPLRNIPPCTTCHGDVAYKQGSTWLEGEPVAYMRGQLQEFASGARHNDVSGQMRNVARGMTRAEIDEAAAFYSQ